MRGAVQMAYTVDGCCDQHTMFMLMLRLTFMLGGRNGKWVATHGIYKEEHLGWLGFGDLPWM